ncbi:MAG: CRISPR-associated helicase Cas3' [Acidobacteriota bacterium]
MTSNHDQPTELLAKEKRFDEGGDLRLGCYLSVHTRDVVDATDAILDAIGNDIVRFFKLSVGQMPRLRATARLAAFCHDLGKANDGFQGMVRRESSEQAIRHEHLSTLLMSLRPLRRQFERMVEADYEIARVVVLGHHLKIVDDDSVETKGRKIPTLAQSLNGEESFTVAADHQQFKKLIASFSEIAGFLIEDDISIPKHWSFYEEKGFCIEPLRDQVREELQSIKAILRKDKPRIRLLRAVKAVFFAADAAASGIRRIEGELIGGKRREEITVTDWIKTNLSRGKTADDLEKLLTKRKAEVIKREQAKGKADFEFREKDFQTEAATLGKRALLLAPCGSGKTYAAYLWIKKQLDTRAEWKVVFLYPTTGTATEGFKDYASHDEDSALVHMRAAFDLEGMFENPDDRSKNNYLADQRLYALGYWPDAIFSATADAFLSFLQNSYSSLCLLPVLARSVIVIDEIHSFDYAMFDALLEFLREFDAPVLMMTASLPKERRKRLEEGCPGIEVFPQEDDMTRLKELEESATSSRYLIEASRMNSVGDDKTLYPSDLLDIAIQTHDQNLKVLWVVNTVDRCINIARALEERNVFCYHSRFEYKHRRDRHREVIDAFHPSNTRGVIAVTTQVCEMSLDLDADVLITEIAPAPSLIQRMGRCNRGNPPHVPGASGRVFLYAPVNGNPYEEESMQSGKDLIASLDLTKAVKQSELTEKLEEIATSKERGKRCLFTMATWESYSGNDFRDTDDFTVSAIRESQIDEFKRLQRARKSVAGLIMQAPRKLCEKERRTDLWLVVVPDVQKKHELKYCKKYGLRGE